MEAVVILSRLEQEYLLSSIESGLRVASRHQLFLWAQGQLQALLPHQVLACLQFAPDGALRRIECVHGTVLSAGAAQALAGQRHGLAARLPALFDGVAARGEGAAACALDRFGAELDAIGFDSALVHGTGQTSAGASVFVLFGLPMRPGPRHAYFLELLLPYLHLALERLPAHLSVLEDEVRRRGALPKRALSERETEIVGWLREGKSNGEMGQILGISGLTVKNHLQRIYRALGVSNRAHALARCLELRLLDA
jgi:transcriptional regulator EpsA